VVVVSSVVAACALGRHVFKAAQQHILLHSLAGVDANYSYASNLNLHGKHRTDQ
jgi:hypothetical protein